MLVWPAARPFGSSLIQSHAGELHPVQVILDSGRVVRGPAGVLEEAPFGRIALAGDAAKRAVNDVIHNGRRAAGGVKLRQSRTEPC